MNHFISGIIKIIILEAHVGLLLIESWAVDGGPVAVARRVQRLAVSALR